MNEQRLDVGSVKKSWRDGVKPGLESQRYEWQKLKRAGEGSG